MSPRKDTLRSLERHFSFPPRPGNFCRCSHDCHTRDPGCCGPTTIHRSTQGIAMRSLRPLLVLHLLALAPSAAPAQDPVRAPEAPTGTNWIADRELKHYFPLDCEA